MYPTTYHKPETLEAASATLGDAEEAKILAGGHTLLPTMKNHLAAPTDLVDIRGIAALNGISEDGGTLTIGATTTHAEVSNSPVVASACPALACLAGGIGDPAVRHVGTIGGSVANNDPAADYPAAVLGLGATVVTNRRDIAAEDFFDGMFATVLEEGEIITSVRFPKCDLAGYSKFPNPASRYAMVGVFVAKSGGSVRVAVTGAGEDGVFRHEGLEAALSANFSPDAVDGVAISSDGLLSDLHGDADYRANLIRVMAKRAVSAVA
ncbi:carbon-monoxide dehydrogenase medium subunit [Aliiruegeria haliotis]|uniref:Carbon-monoxide dehydrogenase medium subunit n=1 Tax=Aliiruegeria haliotis TaxID=1280846 RepID=A0A2T0RRZ1_9RHOB|nr:xanthine dehydrogenase family protein subunit M [Aliiruegeria haliotis]PRY23870.1 carbon-monoxide dehydrogenase medium subunit [Aliiruegeria haliotis]